MKRRVVPVGTDRALAAQWVDVPDRLHHGQIGYVPPLRRDALADCDPRRNPFFRHAEIEHFLLLEGDAAVGRISATKHPAYIERQDDAVGFFGFLDAPEDPDAFGLLLGAVEGWCRDRALDRVAGPFSYWSGQEMGMLVDGHDEAPTAFQTWSPKSYPDLLRQNGYAPRTELTGFRLDEDDLSRIESLLGPAAARSRARGLTTRSLRRRGFAADMEIIRTLFNASFATSPDIVPYEADVFTAMVAPLRPLVDRDLIRILERDGRPIAFCVTVPDVNQILARLGGRLRPTDLLRLPGWKRRVDTAVVLLVGSLPETPMGAAHLLFADTLQAAVRGGYRSVQTSWVHERNDVLRGLMHGLGATEHKQWLLYDRRIA